MINLEKHNSIISEPLELNDKTAKKIFGFNPLISHYKEGKVFFNKYDLENADKLAVMYFGFIIFLAMINFESYLLRFFILLAYIIYALNVFKTKNYIVLDYYKKEFFYEKQNLFTQKVTVLFPFTKIQDISTIYEEKMILTGIHGKRSYQKIIFASIVFLLSDNQSFRFLYQADNNFDLLDNLASKLAMALKKNYLDNTQRLPLTTVLSGGESRYKALLPGQSPRITFYKVVTKDGPITVNPILSIFIIFFGIIAVIYLVAKFM